MNNPNAYNRCITNNINSVLRLPAFQRYWLEAPARSFRNKYSPHRAKQSATYPYHGTPPLSGNRKTVCIPFFMIYKNDPCVFGTEWCCIYVCTYEGNQIRGQIYLWFIVYDLRMIHCRTTVCTSVSCCLSRVVWSVCHSSCVHTFPGERSASYSSCETSRDCT